MRSRYFQRTNGTWLDIVFRTSGDTFTVPAYIHIEQLGGGLTVVETDKDTDPRTVIVPLPVVTAPPDVPLERIKTLLAKNDADITIEEVKQLLLTLSRRLYSKGVIS